MCLKQGSRRSTTNTSILIQAWTTDKRWYFLNKYRFIDLIYDVLTESDIPLSIKEIWKIAEDRGLTKKVNSLGKTPSKSMGSALYTDIKYNDNSKFIQVSKEPPKFFLRVKTINEDAVRLADSKITSSIKIRERDLHSSLQPLHTEALILSANQRQYTTSPQKKRPRAKTAGYIPIWLAFIILLWTTSRLYSVCSR